MEQLTMLRTQPPRQTLSLKNPNAPWVIKELDELIGEWRRWQEEVKKIVDQPYDHNLQSEVYADGVENLKKHRILQQQTLDFLDNNIEGHGFIFGRDGTKIDRIDLRLKIRVQHRIDDLDELRACLKYATVPDTYWKAKAKELVDRVLDDPKKAVEYATSFLKNPGV